MIDIVENLPYSKRSKELVDLIKKRILILDGAMGTMIQQFGLDEADFHAHCACCHCHDDKQMKGCNDILVISRPDVIESLHRQYLDAGADIISTDTFNANAISLADYGMEDAVKEINFAAAKLSRKVADEYGEAHGKTCFVAGSVGPTSKSLTMAANLGETVTFDDFATTYYDQCRALIEGGVDLLAFETCYDTLNVKAAIFAARKAMVDLQMRVPVMISATLNQSGQTLSGMSLGAFVIAVSHVDPIAVGINCGFGAEALAEHLGEIDEYEGGVVFYPNAGLPNELGEYDQTPEQMADEIISTGAINKINILGGCCGTTPAHIAALAKIAANHSPRKIIERKNSLRVAGLEPLDFANRDFVKVGERCNVAGSRKFLRLIKEENYDEAITVAADQIAKGADIIDINMDDGLLDTKVCMSQFLTKIATEPSVAKVPVMVDSSDFNVICAALKLIQGRPIVNSISLKEGEKTFISRAGHIHEMGAAMVVMAFDENGQATTVERRIEVCSRAYKLLTEVGIPPCDIIFDPNILAVATGLKEHDSYAADFISAAKWIAENLKGVNISGGLSNLSFSFRGNDYVRNVMHSLFIDKARRVGMKMAIVNPAGLIKLDTIPEKLSEAVINVLENNGGDATDRLVEIAPEYMAAKKTAAPKEIVAATPEAHLANALITGNTSGIEDDIASLLASGMSAIAIIEKVLMGAMNTVGERFGKGEMFLPQVVKSASVMKNAVEILTPEIEKNKTGESAKNEYSIVLATVKGDVHDIGKNIVAVVLRCNGFDVIDLGVMTPAEKIVETAITTGAKAIGLSGLITPSLAEMVSVAKLMEHKGLKIPLFIGGATTSDLHTALKIAPEYSSAVIHTGDAAQLAAEAKQYLNPLTAETAFEENRRWQASLRTGYVTKDVQNSLTLEDARKKRKIISFEKSDFTPKSLELDITVSEIRSTINRRQYLAAWKLDPAQIDKPEAERTDAVRELLENTNALLDKMIRDGATLKARLKYLPAFADCDDLKIIHGNETVTIPMLRQTNALGDMPTLSLADFVPQKNSGQTAPIGVFVVTATSAMYARYVTDSTTYDGILADLLLSRLAEAATNFMHKNIVSKDFENIGIRPAVGYPSLPDQSVVLILDKILNYNTLDVTLTENGAIFPSATTTGLIFPHKEARYFSIGELTEEQAAEYAARRNFTPEQSQKFLPIIKKYV